MNSKKSKLIYYKLEQDANIPSAFWREVIWFGKITCSKFVHELNISLAIVTELKSKEDKSILVKDEQW